MAGFDNDVVYGTNVDFSGGNPVTGKITANGQLLIGSTALPNIQVGTLTSPNSTVTVGYSSPNITLDVSNSNLFPWTDTQGVVSVASFHGYFITGACTASLPAIPSQGNIISFVVDTSDSLVIQASGTQKIRIGVAISTAGGTASNTLQGDALTLIYHSATDSWISIPGAQGVWNLSV